MPNIQNNLTRFRKEDYPEAPTWWDNAIYTLNIMIDYLYSLTQTTTVLQTAVDDKPSFQTKTIIFTSSATSTTNPQNNTYNFESDFEPVQLLIHATNSSIPVFTSPVWASWHYSKGIVFIDSITGLANSTKYTLTITLISEGE